METDRVTQFKADINDMRLKDPAVGRDRMALRGGMALMAIGVVLGVVAYFSSHSTRDVNAQTDYIIVALLGVALTVVGAALFIRYSMAMFLRFWLARLIFEQGAQTDRIVAHRDGG
jgi:hypothetical protein